MSTPYAVLHGPYIAAGEPDAERGDPSHRDIPPEFQERLGLKPGLVRA